MYMGSGESKLRPLTAADHKGIPLLAALDKQLVAALRSGAIRLLRAEFLRADGSEAMLPKLLRRQELERMEKERGICIFLTPKEAVAALRSLSRKVAGLTYGWASPDHPDVTGEYLANVRRFLRHPLGEHVAAIFWECAAAPGPIAGLVDLPGCGNHLSTPPPRLLQAHPAPPSSHTLARPLPPPRSPSTASLRSRKSRARRPRTSSSPKPSRFAVSSSATLQSVLYPLRLTLHLPLIASRFSLSVAPACP